MSQILTTVCIAAIALALLRLLVPEGKLTGQISLLISCIFVLTVAGSLRNTDFSFEGYEYNIEQNSDYISFSGEVNKQLQKEICSDMRDKLADILAQENIFPSEIHVVVNISGLYSISICQVGLVFPQGQEHIAAQAAQIVQAQLPADIKVVTECRDRYNAY